MKYLRSSESLKSRESFKSRIGVAKVMATKIAKKKMKKILSFILIFDFDF